MINNVSKETFKKLKKLNNKKYRDDSSVAFDILIEGERLIHQVKNFGCPIKSLYISLEKFDDLKKTISKFECPVYTLTNSQSEHLSETIQGQGIFAQIKFELKPITRFRKLLFINGISDPGNLGTIIRTASAFQIDGLIVDEDCCDLSNSKLIRSSLGAVFNLPLLCVKQQWLSGWDGKIFVSHLSNGLSLNKFKFPDTPYIVVIGSEAHGVHESILKFEHERIYIPMTGGMESLNVAVATGIFMYKMNNFED